MQTPATGAAQPAPERTPGAADWTAPPHTGRSPSGPEGGRSPPPAGLRSPGRGRRPLAPPAFHRGSPHSAGRPRASHPVPGIPPAAAGGRAAYRPPGPPFHAPGPDCPPGPGSAPSPASSVAPHRQIRHGGPPKVHQIPSYFSQFPLLPQVISFHCKADRAALSTGWGYDTINKSDSGKEDRGRGA